MVPPPPYGAVISAKWFSIIYQLIFTVIFTELFLSIKKHTISGKNESNFLRLARPGSTFISGGLMTPQLACPSQPIRSVRMEWMRWSEFRPER